MLSALLFIFTLPHLSAINFIMLMMTGVPFANNVYNAIIAEPLPVAFSGVHQNISAQHFQPIVKPRGVHATVEKFLLKIAEFHDKLRYRQLYRFCSFQIRNG